jgi:ankyrin repeat protein
MSKHQCQSICDASYNNCIECVRQFIEDGTDVNEFNDGFTPLHFASYEIAKLLLEHGADVNIQDDTSLTPLHDASVWNKMTMVELLLLHNANINIKTIDGSTPLHLASFNKHKDLVELLLNRRADTHIYNNDNQTPAEITTCDEIKDLIVNYEAPPIKCAEDHQSHL